MAKIFSVYLLALLALNVQALQTGKQVSHLDYANLQGQSIQSGQQHGRIVREPEPIQHKGQIGVNTQDQSSIQGQQGIQNRRIVREPEPFQTHGIQGLQHGGQLGVNTQGQSGFHGQQGFHSRTVREPLNVPSQGAQLGVNTQIGQSGLFGQTQGRITRDTVGKTADGQKTLMEPRGTRITRESSQSQGQEGMKSLTGQKGIGKKVSRREVANTVPVDEKMRWTRCSTGNQSIYDFSLNTLDGQPITLDKFKGKQLLIVNVATFCAYTEHYLDFGPLLDKHQDLRILAFPCNQFGLQEPGEDHEILNGIRYVRPGNDFQLPQNVQMFSKLDVNGEKQHPLFEYLKEVCPGTVLDIGKREQMFWNPIKINDITWNFEKFLIDSEGIPRFRFHPTAWEKGQLMEQFISEMSGGAKVQLQGSQVFKGGLVKNQEVSIEENQQQE